MPEMHEYWFIRSRLKTRQLLLLVSLDDERNVHRAAAALAMTQPAASKLLADIEDALGVQLFERLARGVRPNTYGEIMVRHARMMLSHLREAQEEIATLKSGLTGKINLGAVAGPSAILVPKAIARMNEKFPRVKVRVDVASSDELLPRIQAGRLDILVARLSADHDSGALHFEPIAVEPILFVVRKGHPLRKRPALSLADIASCPFVVPTPDGLLRHRFDLLFQQHALQPPRIGVETRALEVLTGLLLRTDMIAVLGKEVAQPYIDAGMFGALDVDADFALDPYGVITRRDLLLSPSAQVMHDILREEARSAYGALPVVAKPRPSKPKGPQHAQPARR